MDLLVTDDSPSQISDKIKDMLYSKSADKIAGIRPDVASQLFDQEAEGDTEIEAEAEVETETEVETEEEPAEQGIEN